MLLIAVALLTSGDVHAGEPTLASLTGAADRAAAYIDQCALLPASCQPQLLGSAWYLVVVDRYVQGLYVRGADVGAVALLDPNRFLLLPGEVRSAISLPPPWVTALVEGGPPPASAVSAPPAEKVALRVESAPRGGSVFVDGRGTGQLTPAEVMVSPGVRRVEVRRKCVSGAAEVEAGLVTTVRPPLDQRGTRVMFTSVPPAEVTVDGSSVGTTPLAVRLDCGSREVVFTAPGMAPASRTLELVSADPVVVHLTLEAPG